MKLLRFLLLRWQLEYLLVQNTLQKEPTKVFSLYLFLYLIALAKYSSVLDRKIDFRDLTQTLEK